MALGLQILAFCTCALIHCALRCKYHNWSHLVINSTKFGEVMVKVSLHFDRQHASRRAMTHTSNDRTCFISSASSGGACSWTCASNCARSGNCCIYSGGRTRSNFDFCFKSSLAFRFRNAGCMGSTFCLFAFTFVFASHISLLCLAYCYLAFTAHQRVLFIVCEFLLLVSSFSLA